MRCAPIGNFLVISLCLATPAAAEEESVGVESPYVFLERIETEFGEGHYEDVERMAGELLQTEASMLVRAEGLQYLGAALELLGRSGEAEEHFEELVTLQPEFRMNQAFPSEVLRLFESVRDRVQDRIRQIEDRRRRAAEAAQAERDRQAALLRQRLIDQARPRYMVREVEHRSLALAFLPFGAGQFQNGHNRRGYVFMGTQLGLTASSMVLWLLSTLAPENPEDEAEGARLLNGYQIASYAVYGALAVSVAWGIIDALVNYARARRAGDRWSEVDENDVPEEHRVESELDVDALLGGGGGTGGEQAAPAGAGAGDASPPSP
jgi:hypothetical protein